MAESESVKTELESEEIILGNKLRLLRESRGYSIEDVAGQLYLDSNLIRALESGQYNKIPSKAFVSGYIRNYLKLFDAVSEFQEFNILNTNSRIINQNPIVLKKTYVSNKINISSIFKISIALILLSGLAYIEVEYSLLNEIKKISMNYEVEENKLEEEKTVSIVKNDLIEKQQKKPLLKESLTTTKSNQKIDTLDSIHLRFTNDSWVQVLDSTGRKLISKFIKSGKKLEFSGKLPFEVTLGNSRAVKIKVNGHDFKQSNYTNKEIVHFVINNNLN